VIRLDAAYWGLRLIAWIHSVLGAVAVVPWNPKRQKNRSCLPPTWTKAELGASFCSFICNGLRSVEVTTIKEGVILFQEGGGMLNRGRGNE
jgi:hypothetical protein